MFLICLLIFITVLSPGRAPTDVIMDYPKQASQRTYASSNKEPSSGEIFYGSLELFVVFSF